MYEAEHVTGDCARFEDHLARLQAQQTDAFCRYARRKLGCPFLAEDVVQETWLSLCKDGDRVYGVVDRLARRCHRSFTEQLACYARGVLRHKISDVFRRRGPTGGPRHPVALPAQWELGVSMVDTPDWCAATRELLERHSRARRQAIQQLPDDERAAVALRAGGYGIADIATSLGTTPNAVRIRLYRARRKLPPGPDG